MHTVMMLAGLSYQIYRSPEESKCKPRYHSIFQGFGRVPWTASARASCFISGAHACRKAQHW